MNQLSRHESAKSKDDYHVLPFATASPQWRSDYKKEYHQKIKNKFENGIQNSWK